MPVISSYAEPGAKHDVRDAVMTTVVVARLWSLGPSAVWWSFS